MVNAYKRKLRAKGSINIACKHCCTCSCVITSWACSCANLVLRRGRLCGMSSAAPPPTSGRSFQTFEVGILAHCLSHSGMQLCVWCSPSASCGELLFGPAKSPPRVSLSLWPLL
eukprot:2916360-Amphidinium_carterae.1